MPLSLAEFVERWKAVTLTERAASQSHFIDLCEVLGQPHPAAADQTGESFTFEKPVSKLHGGKGFADVWKRGFFAWEYKGKHKDLAAAYHQLADYRDDLENPPLLVVCDMDIFEVHTNFTGTQTRVYKFTLDDLLTSAPTPNCALPPLEVLRDTFTDPEQLRPEKAAARVTESAAREFAKLAISLRQHGVEPEAAAHFLMRLLFCLFADSIGLLPDHLFRQLIELNRAAPAKFATRLRQLFAAMCTSGNNFGVHDIHWFNGGLFADDTVFDLTSADMGTLRAASDLDWSAVEPAIFGTLFERSLDPGKRSQLGAHYTSKEDILLIVEPVVMAPLERRWQQVKLEAQELAAQAQAVKGGAYNKLRAQLQDKLFAWVEELAKVRILDPACGSGNFLYVALRRMLDLWKEAHVFAAAHGLPTFLPFQVTPAQLYGLETNVYAHELASVVVWIGYLQWLNDNGIGWPTEPILRRLDNIQHRDAILAHDADGEPVEPAWPEADFIIGNPPFLGDKKMRAELGDDYVNALRALYEGRVPGGADLVTYWFEKARALIAALKARRAGLLATQGIRGGANRTVLDRILDTGGIFMAWSDREWILDGATVHVSIIGFDNGSQTVRTLDGRPVSQIHANLTSEANTTSAIALPENAGICYVGPSPHGSFDIDSETARKMLTAPANVNGRPNSDVVRPVASAVDLVRGSRNVWTIDFGTDMALQQAAQYELPFEHVKANVYPERKDNHREAYREKWWIYAEARPGMRDAIRPFARYIATPRVSKHRLFVWQEVRVLCNDGTIVFARDDDYFFGVLHSRPHEVWARAQGTQLREAESGFRYTPTSTFETFPFPWPPGHEPRDSPPVEAIADAARELVEKRDAWLNPPDASAEELKKRSLTNLYNARPAWLADAHRKLDEAVFAAYGWPSTFTDAEILERLLALNHQRAAATGNE
jgi:type II restriction/modification system DNA methylase subunit YeeA